MQKENPFDRKLVEKALFAAHKNGELKNRRTRSFLRKMARSIEKAWEIGYRDGAAGKPLAQQESLPEDAASPLRRDIFHRVYVAYSSGYRAGAAEKEAIE